MKSSKVVILLSTYNGERYLAEQLNSLLDQTYRNITIKIRDDGSSDKTREIALKYCASNNNIEFLEGENLGVVGSFFELLYSVEENFDFVAFCDQDDIWHKNKIEVAIQKLQCFKGQAPVMYCGRVRLVDQCLGFLHNGAVPRRPLSLNNALFQNIATGCTIVLNRQSIDLLVSKKPNLNNVLMHDRWIYMVISSLGNIIYDNEPYIDYRQHEGNVVGSSKGFLLLFNRLKRFNKDGRNTLSRQAQEFLYLYENQLSYKQRKLIVELLDAVCSAGFFKRIYYSLKLPVYRQSIVDNLFSKIMLILGIYK